MLTDSKETKSKKLINDTATNTSVDNNRTQAEPQVNEEKVIDIKIEAPKRSKVRINGDPNMIVELSLSDANILNRLETGWTNLQKEVEKIGNLDTDDTKFTAKLTAIDKAMRKQIDFIFDYPVSEVVAPFGTMYDPWEGQIRFEHILDALLVLYADNINTEYKKLRARTKKYTGKYVKR